VGIKAISGIGRVSAAVGLSALLVLSAPGRVVQIEAEDAPPVVPAPANLTPPVVSGLVRIGQVLSSTTGVWTDAVSWAYQWYRSSGPGSVAIAGATSPTYTVVAADMAEQVWCQVVASGPGGTSSPAYSNEVASPWRPILTILGADGWLYIFNATETGITIGAPVGAVSDVRGVKTWTQSDPARQPLQESGCIRFTSDFLEDSSLATLFDSGAARSVAIVFEDAESGSGEVPFAAARTGLTTGFWSLTGQSRVIGGLAAIRFVATTTDAHKLLVVVDDAGGSARYNDDGTTDTDGVIGTVPVTLTNCTLGARRRSSVEAYLSNGIRCLVLVHRALTSGEIATIRAVLEAQGVTAP
jgi:hypothetical protein